MSNRIYYSHEAKQQARQQHTLLAILFTALGLSIGAVIALLFAPMQGEEIREEISQHADKALNTFEEYGEQAKKSLLN